MKAMYYRAYLSIELMNSGCVYPNLQCRVENRQTEFNDEMRNTQLKRCDRLKLINDWFCDKAIDENTESSAIFWANLAKELRGSRQSLQWEEEKHHEIIAYAILTTVKRLNIITRDAVTILRKITFRLRQLDEWLITIRHDRASRVFYGCYPSWNITEADTERTLFTKLPEDVKARLTESWNKIVDIIHDKIGRIEAVKRINTYGKWELTADPTWIKLSYCGHRNAEVAPTPDNGKMKYGFELEGAMSNENFQLAMTKLSKTPFDGGFLLDERNWVMATEDSSLPPETGVEFVFAPFEYEQGQRFWKAVEDILAECGFKRTTPSNEWGVHCHLDANKFETIGNIEAFHNKVYDMETNDKLALYKRYGNRFCNWIKTGNVSYESKWIALEGQFTKDKKQLGYLDKVFTLMRDHSYRYYLINYEHVKFTDKTYLIPSSGTIEIRGFYAVKLLTEAAKDIKEKLLTGIIKGEYL